MKRPWVCIVATILWGLAFFPGCVLALTAVFMSDSLRENQINTFMAFWFSTIAFPIACLLAIAGLWISRRRWKTNRPSLAFRMEIVFSALPLLPIVLSAIFLKRLGM
jgi:hypothetical protein